MSYRSSDAFGRNELFYTVSGKVKPQDKSIDNSFKPINKTKLNIRVTQIKTVLEQLEQTSSGMCFLDKTLTIFKKMILNEITELREANNLLKKDAEASLKTFF